MATTAHHIISNYTTPDQEGDEVPEHEIEALWHRESAKLKVTRRPYKIPTFVKGLLTLGEQGVITDLKGKGREDGGISGWYQELAASRAAATPTSESSTVVASTSTAPPSTSQGSRSSSLPPPPIPGPRGKARRAQADWFIHRALDAQSKSKSKSEPSSLPSTPPPSAGLAGLLAQQPPPKPDEPAFKPPIWYALDPTNRGFAMLRKSGWEEGYGLGMAHPPARSAPRSRTATSLSSGEDEEDEQEIIDLTVSRSPTPEEESIFATAPQPSQPPPGPSDTAASTALLTPLRPVLKADRLGIGLKAKKKSSLSSKEIREHIRAGQDAQRKAELERRGKGWRAFARQAKKDAEERRALMSYLNS
ncbi:hypothetical protein CALCODRAFT_512046 [Calocera cornea HHB12733]|uniref:G-patch domain-containing protein n=1 Tax=Calocera cornea HHB12733 TaxID=1353952 RepID=A0A165DBN5_9BASI|nr:hypothetical protein CALCODRAFT_512046 [Calocera cornea HHB12733]